MGKVTKNKIGPEKNFNVKKNNFFKKKSTGGNFKGGNQKQKPAGQFSNKSPIKSVKDDPFFVASNNANKSPNVKGKTASGFFIKSGEEKAEFHDKNKRKSLKNTMSKLTFKKRNKDGAGDDIDGRRSKFFTLNNKNKSGFVSSPASSGKFFVKEKSNESPSLNSNKSEEAGASDEEIGAASKKPFDKKRWRMQKYSKRYKLEQWEERRKKAILRGYYKDLKDCDNKFNVQKIYAEHQSDDDDDDNEENKKESESMDVENENNLNASINRGRVDPHDRIEEAETNKQNNPKSKNKAFKKAHLEYQRIKEEKRTRREELARKRQERDEALKIYKQKKIEKFKRLNRKTKKGQPIMKERMEMLLEQIQKNLGKN